MHYLRTLDPLGLGHGYLPVPQIPGRARVARIPGVLATF